MSFNRDNGNRHGMRKIVNKEAIAAQHALARPALNHTPQADPPQSNPPLKP